MASKAMWEVDPETRSKLAQIQKKNGTLNDKCCDCGAPSPQWASPKFSTFICLQCAGTHRGLGVHVSFVRSISMDAFKQNEILRMQYGGNKAYQDWFSKNSAIPFDECTIKERYDCELGEEWKERLTAQVEEREFDRGAWQKDRAAVLQRQANRSATPLGNPSTQSNSNSRTASPAPGKSVLPPGQKAKNEAFFERMGNANASRPDDLPPSQGGKYGGFGSSVETQPQLQNGPASVDDFQKDPVAAITKSFGWFGSALAKQAKVVNDSYIQPTAKSVRTDPVLFGNHANYEKLAATDLAAQARNAAITAGQGLQTGVKGATENFNKFVEGQDERASATAAKKHGEPEKKDFWDSFGQSSEPSKPSSIGTSAVKGTNTQKKKEDGWGTDDW